VNIARINEPSSNFISPSDVGQSYVRIVVVGVIIIWTFVNESVTSVDAFQSNGMVFAMPFYFGYCLLFLWLSYYLSDGQKVSPIWFRVKRVTGLLVDLISCGLYIFLSGEYGLAVYPLYVTIIVGYGLRYGFRYLFLAMTVALITFTFAALYSPLFEKFGSLMIGFYLGIILIPGYAATLLKKYQDVLKRLSEVNAARARFIANMSHELRTPLHAIIGNAEVIDAKLIELEQTDPALEPLSNSARMVVSASEHLRALVDGILDVASNDAGTFVLGDPVRTDLYKLIRSAIDITRPDSRKKSIEISWFIDADAPRIVDTWDQHLKAVLINTIGNAVKYTNTGFVKVAVKPLTLGGVGDSCTIQFEIEDTGIGIPAAQLATIYEPFAIGDDGRDRKFEGTGLGLTITKQYLDEMRGSINIESVVGKGTVVVVNVPVNVVTQSTRRRDNNRYRAIVVTSSDHSLSLVPWLQDNGLECDRLTWDGRTGQSETPDFGIPSVVFIEDSDDGKLRAITEFISSKFPGIAQVLIRESNPEEFTFKHKFLTRIEFGNSQHLENLLCLVGRRGGEFSLAGNLQRRILVVDDNETNLQSAKIALESYGHRVTTVTSGSDALNTVDDIEIDLVFMDMHMPGASGLVVAKSLAQRTGNRVPIVILTADATKNATNDAQIPEIAGFLTKPIKPSELQHAVERFIRPNPISNPFRQPRVTAASSVLDVVKVGSFSRSNYDELRASGVATESLAALIQKFADDAYSIINELKCYAEEGDALGAKRLLHKLKGSASAMYIDGLINVVEIYEGLDERTLCEEIGNNHSALADAVTHIAGEISAYVCGGDSKIISSGN